MEKCSATAVILAGGKSSRMGENKLLLPLADKPVIGHVVDTVQKHFAECIIVTDQPEAYRSFPARVINDAFRSSVKNSLTGIHAGLLAATYEYTCVIAGDMPFIKGELLTALYAHSMGYDVTIPRDGPYLQPLCAVYHKNCLPHIEKLLSEGNFKVTGFFQDVRVRFVDIAELALEQSSLSFFNINTPEDYRVALALAGSAEKRGKA